MKNKSFSFLTALFVILSLLIVFFDLQDNKSHNYYKLNSYAKEIRTSEDKRACWISFLDIEKFLQDMDEDGYRIKLGEMYDRIIDSHMNTVIFHVRPMCDAVYPSELFPWSCYISSDRSPLSYNPLSIAIEEAHKKGIKFEAWINPYRVSKNNETTESYKCTWAYEKYKDFIIEYINPDGETCLALDPSREESKKLICDGVSEIIENYDVDGIHFDDYFYVPGMRDEISVEDKKRYVNDMVSSVYKTIKDIRPECEFGISPAGNTDNAKTDGADIETWLSNDGYVDYIMPQLYWSDDFITIEGKCVPIYTERCKEWQSINVLDKPIYAGLALYKAGETSANDTGWGIHDDNLCRQCEAAYNQGYDGFALFRYEWLLCDVSKKELNNLNNYLETLEFMQDESNLKNNQNISNDYYINFDRKDGELYPEIMTYSRGLGISIVKIKGELANIDTLFKGIYGIEIYVGNVEECRGGIEYRTHILNKGWTPWVKDGECTEINYGFFADGVQIRLYGDISDSYDLYYRAGYFNNEFTDWKSNGKIAGEIGLKGAVRNIELKIMHR